MDISVEPHFDRKNVSKEVLELSKQYDLYGLCDNSAIIYEEKKRVNLGDIFLIRNGSIIVVSTSDKKWNKQEVK